jgi:hypothetical protein
MIRSGLRFAGQPAGNAKAAGESTTVLMVRVEPERQHGRPPKVADRPMILDY